jgi:methylenetetrahydrofolate--tRNA-(uracil-5-)-methyltransferase
MPAPPRVTALGAMLAHITGGADAETFQPMNVNFGLMPPLPGRFKRADRKKAYTDRAREKLSEWLEAVPPHENSWGGEPAELVEG